MVIVIVCVKMKVKCYDGLNYNKVYVSKYDMLKYKCRMGYKCMVLVNFCRV